MVGRGPGRRQADAFETFGHPVLLRVHAFADVLAGDAAVGLGPLHRFLHVIRGADRADVVVRRLLTLGEAALISDLVHKLHPGRILIPGRRCGREDVVLGFRRGDRRLVAGPDVREVGHVEADRSARLHHGDDGAAEIADIDVVGARLLDREALRLEVTGLQRNDHRRQHLEAELLGVGVAGILGCVRIGMVVASVDVFRLGDALGLGVTGRPLHHGAAGIGVRRAVEEVVRRRLLRVRILAGRIGQMAGIGRRPHRHLVVGHEADERLGVARAPALQRDHALALPALVVRDGVRNLVGIVDGFHVDRGAGGAAIGVDEIDGIADARPVGLAHERGGAGIVGKMADEDFVLRQGRQSGAREQAAHRCDNGCDSPFHVVSPNAAT